MYEFKYHRPGTVRQASAGWTGRRRPRAWRRSTASVRAGGRGMCSYCARP